MQTIEALEPKVKVELPRDTNGDLSAYVWPGGYPLFFMDKEYGAICVHCARKMDKGKETDIIGCAVNWEDADLYCDECSKRIECAYCDNPNEIQDKVIGGE